MTSPFASAVAFAHPDAEGLPIHRGLGAVLEDDAQTLLLLGLSADDLRALPRIADPETSYGDIGAFDRGIAIGSGIARELGVDLLQINGTEKGGRITKGDVQKFVKAFKAKFNTDPGAFNAYAYDALHVLAQAVEKGGASREGVHKCLSSGESFKTILFGDLTFNAKRRPNNVTLKELEVRKGVFEVTGREV